MACTRVIPPESSRKPNGAGSELNERVLRVVLIVLYRLASAQRAPKTRPAPPLFYREEMILSGKKRDRLSFQPRPHTTEMNDPYQDPEYRKAASDAAREYARTHNVTIVEALERVTSRPAAFSLPTPSTPHTRRGRAVVEEKDGYDYRYHTDGSVWRRPSGSNGGWMPVFRPPVLRADLSRADGCVVLSLPA
jgi:hypothetical protein